MQGKTMKSCDQIVKDVAGDVSDDELIEMFTELEAHKKYLQSLNSSLSDFDAEIQAAKNIAEDRVLAAKIEKRNAAINYKIRLERVGFVMNVFGKKPAEGIEAFLMGVNRAKVGARDGAAQRIAATQKYYQAKFANDLQKTGLMDVLNSGSLDREIGNALWAMSAGDDLGKFSKEAVSIASVVNKWQEKIRIEQNKYGAWIGKRKDYMFRQTHDADKIRMAGFDAWKAVALEKFDIAAMMNESGTTNIEAMLKATHANLATGHHQKNGPEVSGFKGPANIAKRASQQRSIFFKNADAALDYNEQFGTGNVRELIVSGIDHGARNIGLMKSLGTNPGNMVQSVVDDVVTQLKDKGRHDEAAEILEMHRKEKKFEKYVELLDGTADIPGSVKAARRSKAVRDYIAITKLGGMLLSQLSDIPTYAATSRYQGRGFFSGMHEAVTGLGRGFSSQETQDMSAALGVTIENVLAEVGNVNSMNEPGAISSLLRLSMKLNLSNWWQKRMKTSAAFGMSHYLGLKALSGFDAINRDMQQVLLGYNIGPSEWEVIRKGASTNEDGRMYITPDGVRELPTEEMARYSGPASTKYAMERDRADIADKLQTFFADQGSFMALEPDLKTKGYMLQNTRPGTWPGEFARFMMQFKSFTGAFLQKIVGRELYGRGYEGDSVIGALRNGNGELTGLVSLIATMTIMGYASMSLKDLSKGKTPRDPTESPEHALKVFQAALLQGGGLGIYGDFLFGEANRFGNGALETFAGPGLSTAASVVNLWQKAIRGEAGAGEALSLAIQNTPFANLFYLKAALNYALFYRIQESINPGYLRRMEKRAEEENAQTFLVSPAAFAG